TTYADLMSGITLSSLPAETIVEITYTLVAKGDVEEVYAGEIVLNQAIITPVDPTDPDPVDPEVEIPTLPKVTKDVNFKNEWTVENYKEIFDFHINYNLATDSGNFDKIVLEDIVNKNLVIKEVRVLDIDNNIDITNKGTLEINDNHIIFTIEDTSLNTKNIQLVISAQFNNDLSEEELIALGKNGVENIGTLKVYTNCNSSSGCNENIIDSNVVYVYGPDGPLVKTGFANYKMISLSLLGLLIAIRKFISKQKTV
ncbi:MAG: isopeptide-forming domain-containing fimbrial protein, partial [Bacilli bacterium]